MFVGDSYSGNAFCVRFEEGCDPFLLEKLIRHSATVLRSSLVLCVQQVITDVRQLWFLAPVVLRNKELK